MNVTFNPNKINFTARTRYGWTKPEPDEAHRRSRLKGAAAPLDTFERSKVTRRIESKPAQDAYGTMRPKHVSEVVLMYDTPEKLTEYLTGLYYRVREYDTTPGGYDETAELARDVLADIVLFLDCKVDLKRLGINAEKMPDLEKIEYGAQFAFFTTNLEGANRNGFVRPGYIRSANEYVKLVENEHPLFAAGEFSDIMKRLPKGKLESDKRIQDGYDAEYKRACADYKRRSFTDRLGRQEPKLKYSPLYGKLKRLEKLQKDTEIRYQREREEEQRAEYQRWLDDTFMNTN